MSDDRPPHRVWSDVGVPSERLASVAAPVEVSLNQEVERTGLQRGLSPAQVRLRDADLRDWMARVIIPAFVAANKWTLFALGGLVLLDEINLACHLTGDRIITEKVIMALLGATTVQIGVIAVVMARHLFPGRRP
jgi:hypothetical protein